MSKSKRQIARADAIISIYQYLLVDTTHEDIVLFLNSDETLSEDPSSMEFSLWLVDTVIKNIESYKELISKYLKEGWTFDRLAMMEQAILLVAACEILESDLDERIIINEAVINAKAYCEESSYKFINGVLHKLL